MTKKELSQLYWLDKEKLKYEKELEALKLKSYINSPQITGMPQGGFGGDKVADRAIHEKEIEAIIIRLESQAAEKKVRILKFIESIPNSIDRQIVYCRCYCLLSWTRVAKELGKTYNADCIRMRFNRMFEDEDENI